MNKTKLITLWLAVYPITNIYLSPILIFSVGDFLFALLLFLNANKKSVFNNLYYPNKYMCFWGYLALTFFLSSIKYGSFISAIIPGGVAFFIFSLQLGYCSKNIDINLLCKYLQFLSIIAIFVLCLQEASYYILGHRFSAIIPFGNMTDGKTANEMIRIQLELDRSCSIFREPAHVAQFLIIPLILDLFWKNKDRLFSKFTLFLIFGFLLTKSGNGLLALSFVLIIKIIQYYIAHKSLKNKVYVVAMLLIATVSISYYSSTESGLTILNRTSEFEKTESSKSYIRIYRGFDLYSGLSFKDRVFGLNNNKGVFEQTKKSQYFYLFSGVMEEDLYFNCMAKVLIFYGFIGAFLLFLVSLKLYKDNGILGRILLLTFLILSFIGQIFASPLMLFVYVLSSNCQYRKNENCLLYKT